MAGNRHGAGFDAASRLSPDNLPLDAIRAARVLHLSAISQAISASACDACFAAIDAAHGAGAKISYDTNLRLKLWPLPRASSSPTRWESSITRIVRRVRSRRRST